MDAAPMKLLTLLGENKRTFNIPVYQRNYEWNKENILQFFKDIELIIKDNYENGHFLGTIVFVSNEKQGLMLERIIIDGQQRITTTILLLLAIINLLDSNIEDEKELKEEIMNTFILNKYVDHTYRYKLVPVEADSRAFIDIVEHGTSSANSKICTNYNLLKELVNNFSAYFKADI